MFLRTSFLPLPSPSSSFSLLAQKVFKHQSFEFDTDAPMTTYKKSYKKDKYTHARKQW